MTVLYGASGVGKSSILAAGVIPRLRSSPRTAVAYFNRWRGDFFACLKQECVDAVAASLGKPLNLDPGQPFPNLFTALGDAFGGAILVILDQFEEYFLYHPEPEAVFEGELAAAINSIEGESGFALSLRDDWLSRLDRFDARIPNLLSSSLRLDHLDTAAAEEAVRGPLAVYNKNVPDGEPVKIEDELVQAILTEVRIGNIQLSDFGGAGQSEAQAGQARIETTLLQLVMERLWHEEIDGERPSRVMRMSTFQALGRADRILQAHLENAMKGFTPAEGEVCARIFRFLVTPNYKKIAQETTNLIAYAKQPPEVVEPVLRKLYEKRVLRRIFPPPCYEIFHDVLARPVLEWRARYIRDQERAHVEREAAIEAARQEEEARRQREMAEKAQALAEERQQRLVERARALRRAKWLLGAAGMAVLLALFFAWKAHRNWTEAEGRKQLESAHEMISASESNLGTDPEFSLLLALRADAALSPMLSRKYPADLQSEVRELRSESYDALNRAVQTSWVRRTIRGVGEAGVWGVSFTPDLKRMAAAAPDGTVKVWDVSSNRELASLVGEGSGIALTALSPDGRFLATADIGRHLKVWILSSHKPIPLLSMQEAANTVAFSQNDKLLAVGSVGGMVTVYDGTSGKAVFNQRAHQSAVTALAFSRDGSHLATGSRNATARDAPAKVWDLKSGRVKLFKGHTLGVLAVAFNPQDTTLATASSDRTVKLWDLASGRETKTLAYQANDVVTVCFSPHGTRLATGDQDGSVAIWDVATGHLLLSLMGHKKAVQSVFFNTQGTQLITASSDRTVRFWNVPKVHSEAVEDVAFRGDGRRVASVSLDGTAKLWDWDGDEMSQTLAASTPRPLFAMALSRDGRLLATNDFLGTITIYSTATGKPVGPPIQGSASGLSFSPDGERLAGAGPDNTSVVWEVSTGRALFRLSEDINGVNHVYDNAVNDVAYSRDGKLLATAGLDWTARVWDAASGKQLYMLSAADRRYSRYLHSYVIWVSFSPDGQRLAIAPNDKTALIWDFKSDHLLQLTGHTNTLEGIAFSGDGTRVATASLDRTARVWDAHTGEELFRFTHPSGVEQLALTPDGTRLATACDDGMVRVFILDEAKLLSLARHRITRSWTEDECEEYLHQKTCPRELATELSADPAGKPQR